MTSCSCSAVRKTRGRRLITPIWRRRRRRSGNGCGARASLFRRLPRPSVVGNRARWRSGPGRGRRIGVFGVSLTEDGKQAQAFAGLPQNMKVMQWHHAEVKRVPQSGRVLAQSATTAVQSLAIDDHALSTQFHCEFSPQTVAGWKSIPSYVETLVRLRCGRIRAPAGRKLSPHASHARGHTAAVGQFQKGLRAAAVDHAPAESLIDSDIL